MANQISADQLPDVLKLLEDYHIAAAESLQMNDPTWEECATYERQMCLLQQRYRALIGEPEIPFFSPDDEGQTVPLILTPGDYMEAELGETLDLIKKAMFHRNGILLDIEKVTSEMGDLMWYIALLLDTIGVSFEEVWAANLEKMAARHPGGVFRPNYHSDSMASVQASEAR